MLRYVRLGYVCYVMLRSTSLHFSGLHNCLEFSQPLPCLHQDMQTQEKSFLLLLLNNLPEKKSKTPLFRGLIKREIIMLCYVMLCYVNVM